MSPVRVFAEFQVLRSTSWKCHRKMDKSISEIRSLKPTKRVWLGKLQQVTNLRWFGKRSMVEKKNVFPLVHKKTTVFLVFPSSACQRGSMDTWKSSFATLFESCFFSQTIYIASDYWKVSLSKKGYVPSHCCWHSQASVCMMWTMVDGLNFLLYLTIQTAA